MRILLDTNILLELLFDRAKRPSVEKTLGEHVGDFWISALTVTFVMYHAESAKLPKPLVWKFLDGFNASDVLVEDILWARHNDAGDFEDALQVATARREHCEKLLTLDQKFAKLYGRHLPVITIK